MPVSTGGTVTLVVEKDFQRVLFPFDHTPMHYVGAERMGSSTYSSPGITENLVLSGGCTGCARRQHAGQDTSKIVEVVTL